MKQRCITWSVLSLSVLFYAFAFCGACSQRSEKAQVLDLAKTDKVERAGIPAIAGRKIVYTGVLSLVVKSYDKTRIEVDRLLASSGGFVARGETQGSGAHRHGTLTLRIPTSHFTAFSTHLKELGEVVSESIAADDVTEQHVDLSARLSNTRKLEARLLELVAAKTDSVADLLLVEAELGRVRELVERLDAQLRNLNDQVGMATLTLSITMAERELVAHSLGDRMSGALTESYYTLGDVCAALTVGLAALLPWALLFGLIGLVVTRLRAAVVKRARASRQS